MKQNFLLIVLAAVIFTSCSTSYRNGQTPDDVYYSPTKVITENNDRDNRDDYGGDDRIGYEERQIRMNAYDPRWRDLDRFYDYDYRYNPYSYGYNYGYYYNPYYYNSPVYFPGVFVVNPKNNTPRMTSLGSYSNNGVEVVNTKANTRSNTGNYRTYNNSNSNNGTNRRPISPSYSNEKRGSYNTPSSNDNRTYSPSSSGNSGSGRSSSGSGSSGSSVPRNSRGQ